MHLIRESWRRTVFQEFLVQDRRDSRSLRGLASYSEAQVSRARDLYCKGSMHVRSVMCGAALSPAVYDVIDGGPEAVGPCPYCESGEVGTWLHVAWRCPGFDAFRQSWSLPADVLSARLGWPVRSGGRWRDPGGFLARIGAFILERR